MYSHLIGLDDGNILLSYEGHFYVRRIGLYLYKYRIYGTITIYILKGLAPVYHLI